MIIGSKKVGFADEVSKQNDEGNRTKLKKDAGPMQIQPSITFVDQSNESNPDK